MTTLHLLSSRPPTVPRARGRVACATALTWLGLMALPGLAGGATPRGVEASVGTRIPHCVGTDRITFRPGHTGTLLEARDRDRVAGQLLDRHPVLAQDGLMPVAIVLWRPPRGEWLYAALVDHPEQPGTWCIAAQVTAAGIALTPGMVAKYFPAELPSDD